MKYNFILILIISSCTYNELTPVCTPDEQFFIDVVQPIIEDNCMICHGQGSQNSVLETYDDVLEAINHHSLEQLVVTGQMPPYGMPSLSNSDINTINKWINCE